MELDKDFKEFIELLNELDVKYLVIGGYAVNFYGYPRYTKDIDFWLWMTDENIENLLQVINKFGFGSLGLKKEDFTNPQNVIQLGYEPYRIDLLVDLEGIDLIGYFNPLVFEVEDIVEVRETNLSDWTTDFKYDLITIVHGLHYIGDKLKLIRYAASRLKNDGILLANLDIKDVEITNELDSKKVIQEYFRKEGIDYNLRTKLMRIEGNKNMQQDFMYLGADDRAGANYTGQDVVKSYYKK